MTPSFEEVSNISTNSPKISSLQQQNTTEVIIYCQNFNRMKSPAKMKEIYKNLLSTSFDVILATETNWDAAACAAKEFSEITIMYFGMTEIFQSVKRSLEEASSLP